MVFVTFIGLLAVFLGWIVCLMLIYFLIFLLIRPLPLLMFEPEMVNMFLEVVLLLGLLWWFDFFNTGLCYKGQCSRSHDVCVRSANPF